MAMPDAIQTFELKKESELRLEVSTKPIQITVRKIVLKIYNVIDCSFLGSFFGQYDIYLL